MVSVILFCLCVSDRVDIKLWNNRLAQLQCYTCGQEDAEGLQFELSQRSDNGDYRAHQVRRLWPSATHNLTSEAAM